jgi:hypothetical protein
MRIKNITNADVNWFGIRLSSGDEIEVDEELRKIVEDQPALKIIGAGAPEKKKKVKTHGNI